MHMDNIHGGWCHYRPRWNVISWNLNEANLQFVQGNCQTWLRIRGKGVVEDSSTNLRSAKVPNSTLVTTSAVTHRHDSCIERFNRHVAKFACKIYLSVKKRRAQSSCSHFKAFFRYLLNLQPYYNRLLDKIL